MSDIDARAEITRLAALLRVSEAHLAFLAHHDAAALRELRELLTDRLFDGDRGILEGLAKVTKMVPGGIAAKIATVAFTPKLTARVAGLVDPKLAIDLAKRLPIQFLADVAPELDPRRVSAILNGLPSDTLIDAAKIMAAREQYIPMSDFVGVLPLAQIVRTVDEALSDEAVVRTGLVIEDPQKLADILGSVSDERLAAIVTTTGQLDAWGGILRALPQLSPEVRAKIAAAAAGLTGVPAELTA